MQGHGLSDALLHVISLVDWPKHVRFTFFLQRFDVIVADKISSWLGCMPAIKQEHTTVKQVKRSLHRIVLSDDSI